MSKIDELRAEVKMVREMASEPGCVVMNAEINLRETKRLRADEYRVLMEMTAALVERRGSGIIMGSARIKAMVDRIIAARQYQ